MTGAQVGAYFALLEHETRLLKRKKDRCGLRVAKGKRRAGSVRGAPFTTVGRSGTHTESREAPCRATARNLELWVWRLSPDVCTVVSLSIIEWSQRLATCDLGLAA